MCLNARVYLNLVEETRYEKIKRALHNMFIAVCFIITIATCLIYSYIENGTVNVLKTVVITIPIFVGVYIALYLFMKYIGNVKGEN